MDKAEQTERTNLRTMKWIASAAGRSGWTTVARWSTVMARLKRAGLVEWQKDADAQRFVRLTSEGRRMIEAAGWQASEEYNPTV